MRSTRGKTKTHQVVPCDAKRSTPPAPANTAEFRSTIRGDFQGLVVLKSKREQNSRRFGRLGSDGCRLRYRRLRPHLGSDGRPDWSAIPVSMPTGRDCGVSGDAHTERPAGFAMPSGSLFAARAGKPIADLDSNWRDFGNIKQSVRERDIASLAVD